MRWAVLIVMLLAGCTATQSQATQSTTAGLTPLQTVTIAGQPSPPPTTSFPAMPPVTPPTTVPPPAPLNRDTEVAVRHCVLALDDDLVPYTLLQRNLEPVTEVLDICDEAVVQLQVEPPSTLVDTLMEQVVNAQQAIGLAMLARTVTEADVAGLVSTLNGYAIRIRLELDVP